MLQKILKLSCVIIFMSCCNSLSYSAESDLISLFPIENYNQSIDAWLDPNDKKYDTPLMDASYQQQRLQIYLDHYFGAFSPWNPNYVNSIINQPAPNNLKTIEQTLLVNFDNEGKPAEKLGYGENFRLLTKSWIAKIGRNINLAQFDNLSYRADHRGIAIRNIAGRVLPTSEVHFYSYKLAGQGYPFDNLQMSSLWAGTPVYILAESLDHAWYYVLTPDFIAWVKSSDIALVDDVFVRDWSAAAKLKSAAITHEQTSLEDSTGKFLSSAYVGSVFPVINENSNEFEILFPVLSSDHAVIIKTVVSVSKNFASIMPLAATPHHFAMLIKDMNNRPYGWGGMYFYNDCSAELKSLFTPFGIWLPRHSSNQVTVGRMEDWSALPPEARVANLIKEGKSLVSIIYIGGHVILYIGKYPNPNSNGTDMAMTYQNLWGLSPNPATRRAVIGESVLFPMLLQYPEDTSLISLAAKKYFQIAYLDEMPNAGLAKETIDLRMLMMPEALNP